MKNKTRKKAVQLSEFKDIHKGQPIFVIGSGKSVDFYNDKNMFKDMVTIGVNYAVSHFPLDYVITQHHNIVETCFEMAQKVSPEPVLFVPEHNIGLYSEPKIDANENRFVVYKHNNQPYQEFSPEVIDMPEGHLFVGCTTILSGISLAIYMGATNIILVGVDAGTINGETNYIGYYANKEIQPGQHYHSVATNAILRLYRDELAKKGINVVSLSPFLDFDLEGNNYDNEFRLPHEK